MVELPQGPPEPYVDPYDGYETRWGWKDPFFDPVRSLRLVDPPEKLDGLSFHCFYSYFYSLVIVPFSNLDAECAVDPLESGRVQAGRGVGAIASVRAWWVGKSGAGLSEIDVV